MELDHFRPWSIQRFAHLKDSPLNFHHACGRCNRLKSDHWPCAHASLCHDGTTGFVDPFGDDRRSYFRVELDGTIVALQNPGSYLIKLLQLERPLLKLLRLRRILRRKIATHIENILPEIKAAANGHGNLSREELAREWLKLLEYYRLLDLCDVPVRELNQN